MLELVDSSRCYTYAHGVSPTRTPSPKWLGDAGLTTPACNPTTSKKRRADLSKRLLVSDRYPCRSTTRLNTVVNVQTEAEKELRKPSTMRPSRSTPTMRAKASPVLLVVPPVPAIPADYKKIVHLRLKSTQNSSRREFSKHLAKI